MGYFYYCVSFFLLFLSLLFLYIGCIFMMYDYMIYLDWDILIINSSVFLMSFILDYMSMIFTGCVFMISSMVIFYSYSYMYYDVYKYRFLLLVSMFVLSMMFMVISPNMVSILLGWDGLGLVSYCLVIYFQNFKSYGSGMLTVLTNRIGDVAILMMIAWMLNFGSWSYIYYLSFYESYMYMIVYMAVLSAFTKSAQIPFSSWLPAAMAAPTPVSALVHSSTLVTAGVYLMIRFSYLLYNVNCVFFVFLSMITMFMSGLGANFEYDLKKIVAMSTLSQLGLMMGILFMGYYKLSFFHLLTHAFFKALLFMCSGLIIHNMNNSQDIREMSYVVNMMPYTSVCMLISSFSLCGLPFLSGFYSKDLILELLSMNMYNYMFYFIYIISVFFTVSYSFRLMNYLMFNVNKCYGFQSYYEDNNMTFSMILLTFMSMVLGVVFMWLMFDTPILVVLPFYMKIAPLLCIFSGFLCSYFLSFVKLDYISYLMGYIIMYMGMMWFMPFFSTYMLYSNFMYLMSMYGKYMDMGWGEFLLSKSHFLSFSNLSKFYYILEYNNYKLFLYMFLFLFIIMLV
uniref:NADH-ubiquinone oxidoreductase chain 5 n=1 Tax=Isometopus sp. TaxID=2931297 RepID=A0A8T9ZY37_9HEMI|nr:NADH dehydrogenase subunit 5 [Isometopus sp.]